MDTTEKSFLLIFPYRFNFLNKYSWFFLSLFSALLLILSFPSPGYSFLAWVAVVPLIVIVMTESFKKIILSSLITGVVFNIVYLIWIKDYKHPASLPGSVFTEMMFFSFSVLLSWFLYRNLKLKRMKFLREFVFAAGWLTIDYMKTIGYLAFPWGILGYSQYENLILIQTASIFGVWGITFIIIYCNTTLASAIIEYITTKKLKSNLINVCIIVLLCAFSISFGILKILEEKHKEYRSIRTALIQANFDPWSPKLDENISKEISLTQQALKLNPDLIVWSESSVPFPYEYYLKRGNKHALRVHNFIGSVKKPFVFGSIEFDGEYENGKFHGDFYNVAIFYNKGKLQEVYRKIHLVPFGEWFPFDKIFPFVARILENAGAGDFTPGEDYVIFDAEKFKFSVLICFEDVFGNLIRKFIPEKTELFINVTNDAWTGSEKAAVQHFSISIFRTIENRRSLIRAANGGVTAYINPYGRVIDSLELFTSDYLVCDVLLGEKDEVTFYSRYGDFFPWLILILVCTLIIFIFTKKVIDRMKKLNNM
ncbi:Apolipoprotein N-acyltransferase [subsurface metagenome]